MRLFIKTLDSFEFKKTQLFGVAKSENLFLDYVINESSMWFKVWFGFDRNSRKQKIYEALNKAKLQRRKENYQNTFSYIAHPKINWYDDRFLNEYTALPQTKLPKYDDSKIYVTTFGREFIRASGFLNDLKQECGTLIIVLWTVITTIITTLIGVYGLIHHT
jgi:hypothetical protein